jgi:hypothetical protein
MAKQLQHLTVLTENVVMSVAGRGTKNDCAAEGQHPIAPLTMEILGPEVPLFKAITKLQVCEDTAYQEIALIICRL